MAVLFPGRMALPIIHGTASTGGPIPRLLWSHPPQSPHLRTSASPLISSPIRATQIRIPEPACTTASRHPVSAAGLFSKLLGSGMVPVACVSRGLQLHKRCEACGALGYMESVPLDTRAKASHGNPRSPRLPGYHPRRLGARPVRGPPPQCPGGSFNYGLAVW